MKSVTIGDRAVGPGEPTFVVAEIGINHNGSVETAKRLIEVAKSAGCDAVKFQKRTIDVVYSPEDLARPRESPFGTTNGDLKRALEFGYAEYAEIHRYCQSIGMLWFTSCWDKGSVDFIEQFTPPCYKIASPCLTDDDLLRHHRRTGRPALLSTGMSTIEQIDHAAEVLGHENLLLLHCTSTYPANLEELNLRVISTLLSRYDVPVGYSGHEVLVYTTLAAVVLGACLVERHVTLSRAMWGSDHAASIETQGINKLVGYIRSTEVALGDSVKRVVAREVDVMKKMRRVSG